MEATTLTLRERREGALREGHPGPAGLVLVLDYAGYARVVRGYSLLIRRLCSRHATPSKWPTETTFAVTVGHREGVVQALTLEHMH